MKTRITALCALMACSAAVDAQMTLSGELRPRAEYRHGYKSLIDSAQDGSTFITQRSRLLFGYKAEKYSFKLSLQDVRTWGSQTQQNITDGLTSVHEAWGEYKFNKKIATRMGRQELVYDDSRLFGNADWNQQGRSHDLVLLKFTDSTLAVHAGAAYNQNAESSVATAYTVPASYKELHFIWLNKQVKAFNISVLFLNNGYQSPVGVNGTRFSQTAGTHVEYKKSKWGGAVNLYSQLGEDNSVGSDGKIRKMNALLAAAELSCAGTERLSVVLGAEYQSGQSQTDTATSYKNVNHAFNPLYGTAHKFNGFMDYFYAGNHINSVGLVNAYTKLRFKSKKYWAAADLHLFSAAADILDKTELLSTGNIRSMNNQLATELDLTFSYTLAPSVVMQAGYSQLFGTASLEMLKGGRKELTQNWAYLMFIFKPNFME